MSASAHFAVPRLLSETGLLLAVSDIAVIELGFRSAVNQIERLLVESELCSGLVVLEKRGVVTFPLAGSGGPIRGATPQTVLSRPMKAGTRKIQVVFLTDAACSQKSLTTLEFVTEQIGKLLDRDGVLQRSDLWDGCFHRRPKDGTSAWNRGRT